MALAETAELAVKLTLGGNFVREMGKVNRSLKGFDRDSSRALRAGQQIGTGLKRGAMLAAAGVGVLVSQIGFGLDSLIELESLNAQTVAGLKSTSAASGQTADSIRKLAEKYEGLNATIDDKVIQSGENLLLTFTAVGKEAFEPALLAALNMTKALGKPLETNILAIGKALQDPVKGVTALGRAGVDVRALKPKIAAIFSLTKEEAKRLAALKKTSKKAAEQYLADLRTNKTLRAQKLILAELNVEFGGRFAAGAGTVEERVAAFGDAIEDVQKNLASAFLPVVSNVATELQKLLQDPSTTQAITDLSKDLAKLFSPENIRTGIGLLKDGFNALKSIAGPIGDVIKTAVGAFTSLPPDVQKLLIGGLAVNKLTGGLVTNIAGGIFGALKAMTVQAGVVNVTGGVVNGPGGLPGKGPGLLPAAAGAGGIGGGTAGALVIAPIVAGAILGELSRQAFAGMPSHQAQMGLREQSRAAGNRQGFGSGVSNAGVLPVLRTIATNTALVTDKDSQANARQATASEKVRTAVETMRGRIADELSGTTTKIGTEGAASRSTSMVGAALSAGASRSAGASIVSALYATRPMVSVNVDVSATSVTHKNTTINRYGPSGGSRYVDGGNIKEGGG